MNADTVIAAAALLFVIALAIMTGADMLKHEQNEGASLNGAAGCLGMIAIVVLAVIVLVQVLTRGIR